MGNNYHSKSFNKRRRRRRARRKAIIALVFVMAVGLGVLAFFQLPFVRVERAIAAGDKYTKEADYQAAIESYSKALEIDPTSVIAYSNIAGAYVSIGDTQSAKEILREGWQATGEEELLKSCHTLVLSEALNSINNQDADMDTAATIMSVLEEDRSNTEAIQLLDKAYSVIFSDAYSYSPDALFNSDSSTYSSENGSKVYSFDSYREYIEQLLDIYRDSPSDSLGKVIQKYSVPECSSFNIKIQDAADYAALIEKVQSTVGSGDEMSSLKECLDNAQQVQTLFSDIFSQLDIGNVDELRNFVVSDEYLGIRDIFLHNEETPQENTTYVPVSREFMILNNNDGNWTYRFPDFDENPDTAGVLTIWANFFEDNGVQRCAISYEPASVTGEYYPHTKYTVTYLNSYITSGNSTRVARMNYRLSTVIYTSDGEEDETVVGDWGGANEWTMDIDTIESRIRA